MINVIIIDDDTAVRVCLSDYILQFSFLKLVGSFSDPVKGLERLNAGDIQLVLMDIGMPGINGIELTRLLKERFDRSALQVIFITGFDKYAIESYRLDALDYLLKPVSLDQFTSAIYKARSFFERDLSADYIFLKVEQELRKVYLKDICYIESARDYIKVFLTSEGQMITALSTLTGIAEKLPHGFMQVHRSFIVSLDKITAIQHQTVRICGTVIPISEQYRASFRDFTARWS